jgi:Leucine Rich repeat
MRSWLYFVGVWPWCCWVVEAATKSSPSEKALPLPPPPKTHGVFLDLSHHPHLQAKTLANVIQSHVVDNVHDDNKRFSIDLSSSSVGDDGMQQILEALLTSAASTTPITTTTAANANAPPPLVVSLFRARMNNLSPLGATAILQAIMQSRQKNAATTNTTGIDDTNSTHQSQQQAEEQHESSTITTQRRRIITTRSLDLSWNHFSPDEKGSKAFHRALQKLFSVAAGAGGPEEYDDGHGGGPILELRLDCCGLGPAACRAMGKGIVNCYTTAAAAANIATLVTVLDDETTVTSNSGINSESSSKKISESLGPAAATTRRPPPPPPPLSLSLCGNPSIGDAGAAALAAAIRTAATSILPDDNVHEHDDGTNVFDELILSGCDIGDAGAEALALALEDAPAGCCCVKHLDLSNNRITNKGAMAIGRALTVLQSRGINPKVVSLDLSNNKEITDRGVSALATALGTGHLHSLSLRSCHVYADGAALFGKALLSLMSLSLDCAVSQNDKKDDEGIIVVALDLSGNPVGILRGKKGRSDSKMGSGGSMYSASRIKSKATATAASYMSLLRKGLKDVGVDALLGGSSSTLESDDEADDDDSKDPDGGVSSKEDNNDDPTKSPCGAKALVDSFLGQVNDSDNEKKKVADDKGKGRQDMCFRLGLRHCFLDHDAADALAALVVHARDTYGIEDLSLDVSMNNVLEDEMVAALQNDEKSKYDSLLTEMAERHVDIRDALLEAQQRAAEARAAVARARELEIERQREVSKRKAFFAFGDEDDGDDAIHDSDADYENDGEEDYY